MTKTTGFFVLQLFLFCCIALSVMRFSTALHNFPGNETDRLALLALKDQITPDPQGVLNLWNDSLHFCKWEGVTCGHRHERVTKLNLESQRMTGSISPYVGNLSFLRSINLRNNSLSGHIPQEIGRLFRLRDLDLRNNSLSGPLPVNISHCTILVNLLLGHNKLTGEIPEEFGSFQSLIVLALNVNILTGVIPSSFGNLSSLEFLLVGENSLNGYIPYSLGQLKSLTFLQFHVNNLSGMVPPSIYNLSSLKVISATLNKLEGTLPTLKLPNLQNLLLGGNQFSGSIPTSLFTNASELRQLELASQRLTGGLTGEVPIEIGNLKRLERLNLEENYLGSDGQANDLNFITALNNCSNLRMFSIFGNHFGGTLPSSISNLSVSTLRELNLGKNQIVGAIPSDIWKLVNLIRLSIDSNFFTGTIPKDIGMLQKLQKLEFGKNRLTGQIPYSIGNMSSVYMVDLSENYLEGNIVTSFEKCERLQVLYLGRNNLTGGVPIQVLSMQQLFAIDFSRNSFTGSLPMEVGNLKNLQWLAVSENNLSGEIPPTIGNCLRLERLYLHNNFFQGLIPSSFRSLKTIILMDLSRNNLSGKIPKDLENLPYLKKLNLSFNNLEGELPTRGVFQNASEVSIVGNSKLCGGVTELNLLKCETTKSTNNSGKKKMSLALKVTLGVFLPSAGIIATYTLLIALYSRRKPRENPFSNHFMKDSLQRISYNQLRQATNDFSSESLVGKGSYGSVYKGVLQKDERLVAVKVLNLLGHGASKSFMVECQVLRKVVHRNLMKILTVCSSTDFKGNDFKALVFEFMPNGSLENWLHPNNDELQRPSRNLNLLQRLNIAIDVASALDYLHNYCQTPIVHCDLKPSNVLLNDDMVAYVGDFGIAKILSKNKSSSDYSESKTSSIRGTIGYIPPEYGMDVLVSTQGDVYSYGMMLLEMFTGKRPTDAMFDDSLNLHNFCKVNLTVGLMDILDTCLVLQEIPNGVEEQICMTDRMRECLTSVLEIGVACSSHSAVDRMSISEVLKKLHMHNKEVIVGIQDHGEM